MPTETEADRCLPRERRIREGREFLKIRNEGRRMVRGCLAANWVRLTEPGPSRVGTITSRKIGNSVARSRARRLLRESFRLHQKEFASPVAIVLVARSSIISKSRQQVEADFLAILHDARLLRTGEPETKSP